MKDEQDIIRSWIDYHLARGVAHLIIRDTGSTDLTWPILRDYDSDPRLTIFSAPGDDFDQAAWASEMADLARERRGADWVLHGDADEFWWPTATDLPAAFAAIPDDAAVVSVPRSNFLLSGEEVGRWWERVQTRDLRRINYEGRPLHPKHAHRALRGVTVDHGAMSVRGPGGERPWTHPGLEILHIPARTRRQMLHKVHRGALALDRTPGLPRTVGSTWRRMAADTTSGRLHAALDRECLTAASLSEATRVGTAVRDGRLTRYLRDLHHTGALGRHDPAVIIPAYGQQHLTHQVLSDLARDETPCAVYVVDNGGDYQPIGTEYVIRPGMNLHWAGGCNLGLLTAQDQGHRAYVLLNNDVRLSPGFLAGLLEAARLTGAGVVAPVYDRNWPQQRVEFRGPAQAYQPTAREDLVPFADGTCLLIPHPTLRQVGLIDERTWPEYGWGCDKDYALRVRQAGGTVHVTHRAYLNHLGRQTASRAPWYDERAAEHENDTGMATKWGPYWRDLLYHGFGHVPRAGLVQQRLAQTTHG